MPSEEGKPNFFPSKLILVCIILHSKVRTVGKAKLLKNKSINWPSTGTEEQQLQINLQANLDFDIKKINYKQTIAIRLPIDD